MMTTADRWLLVFLFLAGIFLLAWRAGSFSGGLQEVQVVQEGREVLRLALAGQEAEVIPLTLRGGQAFLEVADGAVRLRRGEEPFCPRETCLATGWIKRPGATIVCVPNRLVVRILETGEAAVDAVSR